MARSNQTRHTPRKHYTAEELVSAAILDLEVDVNQCTRLGIHPEYAARCREEIAQLRAELAKVSGK